MKLTFIRHGETVENRDGIILGQMPGVLSEHGIEQVREVASFFTEKQVDYVYCSDLQRCVDTAKPILDQLSGVPVVYTKVLREISFGDYEGLPSSSINWDDLPGTVLSRKAPNGESGLEMRARVLNALNDIFADHVNDSILVITHGGVIKNLISITDDLNEEQMFALEVLNTGVYEREIHVPLTDNWAIPQQ